MSTPPPPLPAAKTTPSFKGCLLWTTVVIVVIIGIAYGAFMIHESNNAKLIAYWNELEKQTKYEAKIFPASVTFRRGQAQEDSIHGPKPWRKVPGEFATCPDDSEGQEYAEFYLAPDPAVILSQPFADATHPQVRRQLESFFTDNTATAFDTAIVLRESSNHGWKLRSTLVPTPYGSDVMPENLPDTVIAKLSGASVPKEPTKGKVDLSSLSYTPTTAGRPNFGKSKDQAEYEARQRVERDHKAAMDRHDDKHHHFFLVEAVRDFGGGRIIIVRRFGQVFGPTSITRATDVVTELAASVTVGTP